MVNFSQPDKKEPRSGTLESSHNSRLLSFGEEGEGGFLKEGSGKGR